MDNRIKCRHLDHDQHSYRCSTRERPKTTMEALRWCTAASVDPLIQKRCSNKPGNETGSRVSTHKWEKQQIKYREDKKREMKRKETEWRVGVGLMLSSHVHLNMSVYLILLSAKCVRVYYTGLMANLWLVRVWMRIQLAHLRAWLNIY